MKAEIAERIRLINKGQVPEGYKKNEIGIIPIDWNLKLLDEIAHKISVGLAVSVSEYFREQGKLLIRNQNIKDGHFDSSDLVYIDEKFDEKNKNKRVLKGDILLTRTGSKIGAVCVVPDKYSGAQTFTTLIVRPLEVLDSNYFVYNALSIGTTEIERLSSGEGKPNLNSGNLKEYRISLPPLPEQQKIVSILSTWNKAVKLKEKLISEKKKQKIALMQELLTGKKRLYGFNENVKQLKLKGHIKEISIKNRDNQVSRILSVTNSRGFVEQSEQFDRQIASSNLTTYKIVRRNQFGYNPSRINVGSVDVLTNYNEGLLSPIYVIFETVKESLTSDYMFQFIKSPNFNNQMKALLQGSVRDNLSFYALSEMKLFIPSIPEQTAIANILCLADKEISLLEKELQALKEQKKGLMQLLLTGIVRVN